MLSMKEKKERVRNLAAKYGPFVRFYPDGNEGEGEGEGAKGEALNEAIKEGEKAELKDNEEFDKARQRADQEAANARKAREQLSDTQEGLETARTENEQLKEQLAAAEKKASEAGIEDVTLDEEDYVGADKQLVKAIKTLEKKITAREDRIFILEKKATQYEDKDRQSKEVQQRNTVYEELLTDLDTEYGADLRNAAVKKFNELIADGKVPKGNPTKATRAMEQCYKNAKKDKDSPAKKDKSSLPLDSGSGGGSAPNLKGVDVKSGSLDEVAAQYGKALAPQKG